MTHDNEDFAFDSIIEVCCFNKKHEQPFKSTTKTIYQQYLKVYDITTGISANRNKSEKSYYNITS